MNFFALCIIALISVNLIECGEKKKNEAKAILDPEQTDKLQKALSSIPTDKIPDKFKAEPDNSHWCCKINPPLLQFDQTRAVSYQIINSENVRCGTTSCGFLGWKKCTRWCTNYWYETRYHAETYTVTQQQECPPDQVICCTNYFFILNHCFHISEVQNNLELLAALNGQGIVLPGIGK